jgi:AcrR family transcriptional regulator
MATSPPTTPPPTDRRRERHLAKRATIVAEAWALAQRDGLAAVSLRDLADQVGLRQPSLYAYFDSKLALYDVMFADGNRQLIELVSKLPVRDDPEEALVEFVEAVTRFSAADTVRHQLLFQRTIPGFEPSPESYAVAEEFYAIAQARLVAVGVSDPADVDLFTALVSGLGHQQVANDPGGDRWVQLSRRTVDMYLAEVARHRRSAASATTKRRTAKRAPARKSPARKSTSTKPAAAKSTATKSAPRKAPR